MVLALGSPLPEKGSPGAWPSSPLSGGFAGLQRICMHMSSRCHWTASLALRRSAALSRIELRRSEEG